jgi:hypothetical protein
MWTNIPQIDTSKIPWDALLKLPLAESIARLDAIRDDEIWSPDHSYLVQQVINDARVSGFDVLGNI